MGKWEIQPLATPKPLNRSSQKVANVITSRIHANVCTHAKFSHDPSSGFFSPYVRNCASKMFTRLFLRVLPTAHSQGPRINFHAKYVKRGCAFSGLENNNNLTFNPPPLFPKTAILACFWRDKIFCLKPLYKAGCSM